MKNWVITFTQNDGWEDSVGWFWTIGERGPLPEMNTKAEVVEWWNKDMAFHSRILGSVSTINEDAVEEDDYIA